MIHFPFLTKFGPFNSQVASHPKGDRVVAAQPCWKWLQHLANQGWNGWTNRKMIYKWWVFRIFVSSQRHARATGNETPFFYHFMGFGGGLLTLLSTCSHHLCFASIGVGWTGHVNVPVNLLTSSMLREHRAWVDLQHHFFLPRPRSSQIVRFF